MAVEQSQAKSEPKSEPNEASLRLAGAGLPVGMVVAGRYRVEACIGEGGTARVYRARQLNVDRQVALKILHRRGTTSGASRRRLIRQVRAISTLRHPGAITIYDVGQDGLLMYIAMELRSDKTLRTLLAKGPLSLGDALEVTLQIAEVLVAAHSMPLAHRDLKPQNIFVSHQPDGRPRVTVADFGLAFIDGRQDLGRMTAERLLSGTPTHFAPEQTQGQPAGPAADIYALGCLLYEMVTGDRVFAGNEMNVLTHHAFVVPTPVATRCPNMAIPESLDLLILAMLAKHPIDRPSARGLVRELRHIISDRNTRRESDDSPTSLRTAGARRSVVEHGPDEQRALDLDPDRILDVGVVGEIDANAWVAMPSHGLFPKQLAPVNDGFLRQCDVLVTTMLDPRWIGSVVRMGVPVVVVVPSFDVALCARLIRGGASEVIGSFDSVERLIGTLRRATTRVRRRVA